MINAAHTYENICDVFWPPLSIQKIDIDLVCRNAEERAE